MEKVQFTYSKKGEEPKDRELLRPMFLKESYNSFKTLDNDNVKYIQGYEINKEGLNEDEIKNYEEVISDYYELALTTLEEFLKENGLDSTKVVLKTFKKEQITNFNS